MDLLTVKDVAKKLSVSETTVRQLIKSGEIKSIKIRKCVRILEDSYNQYVDNLLIQSNPAIRTITTKIKRKDEDVWS